MARIAVAGGTGALGRTFVDALAKTKHQVIVLSRSDKKYDSSNVKSVVADYGNVASLTTLLESHKIDTVLSAINMISDETSRAQLNLIAAAEAASVTKRFIPSEFGVVQTTATAKYDPFGPPILANAEALAETKTLQHTRIAVGFFMDFWAMPKIPTTLNPFKWAIDIEKGVAAIPGTGEERLSMTYTHDLTEVIVKLLDEADWPELTAVVGQDVTFNEVVAWAEAATGRKFKVTYDSEQQLQRGEVTPLDAELAKSPEVVSMWQHFGVMALKGLMLMPDSKGFRLNERFPELKPLTVEKMIKDYWSKA